LEIPHYAEFKEGLLFITSVLKFSSNLLSLPQKFQTTHRLGRGVYRSCNQNANRAKNIKNENNEKYFYVCQHSWLSTIRNYIYPMMKLMEIVAASWKLKSAMSDPSL